MRTSKDTVKRIASERPAIFIYVIDVSSRDDPQRFRRKRSGRQPDLMGVRHGGSPDLMLSGCMDVTE